MNNRVCIIGTSNLKHISLISLYTRYFDKEGISYDIIYLDRYCIDEKTNANHVYRYSELTPSGRLAKLKMFWRFRRYAKNILKKNDYAYLITWQTTGAYLFADILLRWYKNRFVINVRDYVIENNIVFRAILKRLVKKSYFTTISSDGFRSFLPKAEYIKVNSVNEEILENICGRPLVKQDPIKIGFAGNCRYFRESYKLIDALANDNRFELWYCGTNSEVLEDYASKRMINNVRTMPTFDPKDTIDIMSDFNIVNSAFGSDAMDNSTLMPIRLYTAIAIRRPILVNSGTQLAKEVVKGNIGYVIDGYSNLADNLYLYYQSLVPETFSSYCEQYLKAAREENEVFYSILSRIR